MQQEIKDAEHSSCRTEHIHILENVEISKDD
jgi:hypothetical protein